MKEEVISPGEGCHFKVSPLPPKKLLQRWKWSIQQKGTNKIRMNRSDGLASKDFADGLASSDTLTSAALTPVALTTAALTAIDGLTNTYKREDTIASMHYNLSNI